MNQAELVEAIALNQSNEGLSKKSIKWVLDTLAEQVYHELAGGSKEVTLPGIGKLTVKAREARTARNPRTGEEIAVPAKKVPHFSALKALKDAVK